MPMEVEPSKAAQNAWFTNSTMELANIGQLLDQRNWLNKLLLRLPIRCRSPQSLPCRSQLKVYVPFFFSFSLGLFSHVKV